MRIDEDKKEFDHAAERTIELGNLLLDEDHDTDSWEVASGLLAGAVHFWLYSRQPCGDLHCEACGEIDTAHKRLTRLAEETQQFAGVGGSNPPIATILSMTYSPSKVVIGRECDLSVT